MLALEIGFLSRNSLCPEMILTVVSNKHEIDLHLYKMWQVAGTDEIARIP